MLSGWMPQNTRESIPGVPTGNLLSGKPRIIELDHGYNTSNSRVIALNWINRMILSSPICTTAVLLDTVFPPDQ